MMTFTTLMAGHQSAEIRCLYRNEVVRRLTVKGDMIEVDAMTIKVDVRMQTMIVLHEWALDRGSLMFHSENLPPHIPVAKLCTEGDRIIFDDGTEGYVQP